MKTMDVYLNDTIDIECEKCGKEVLCPDCERDFFPFIKNKNFESLLKSVDKITDFEKSRALKDLLMGLHSIDQRILIEDLFDECQ